MQAVHAQVSSGSKRKLWVVVLEAASLVIAATLFLVILLRSLPLVESPLTVLLASLAAVAGYFLADVATGFVHWFCDTFFEEDTPVVGALLIAPFREHHRDPLAMTRHGFLELTGNSCLALSPPLAAALWLGPESPGSNFGAAFYTFVLAFSFSAAATNLFHRWAHDPHPPRWARLFQTVGLILSAARHAQHHAPPHNSAYCVTNGWANRFVDRLGLFTIAERVLVGVGLPRSAHHQSPAAQQTVKAWH